MDRGTVVKNSEATRLGRPSMQIVTLFDALAG